MASVRKLSAFRQLSLTADDRRKTFKKQFSEELKEKPRPRIAWADSAPSTPKPEGIIVKKCIKEVKKTFTSLEKESILYSKQELAERLRHALKEKERPNLNIFLAHNAAAGPDEDVYDEPEPPSPPPKIIPPLIAAPNVFQIRKSRESTSGAVVVIPVESPPADDSKAIKDVIIRPATAAAKRERFQKRTNTAFNSMDGRPPLVRSSSAPTRPEQAKPKFLASKRKIKSGKRREEEVHGSNKENPKSKKEMNRYVPVNGSEIVTMVSLISPAVSDNEEVEVEKPKTKSSPCTNIKKEEKEAVGGKSVSLRKTVKSVTFQQSSIHAIRSFSASFPARRGSMATALMLGINKGQKNQEKRTTTNSTTSEEDERGPKRRLVRSATDKTKRSSEDEAAAPKVDDEEGAVAISVDIKARQTEVDDGEPPPVAETTEVAANEAESDDGGDWPKFGSAKEKECWEMYCKMAGKGLKVSYDTILRGMLTPTEYRMRRKESISNVGDNAEVLN